MKRRKKLGKRALRRLRKRISDKLRRINRKLRREGWLVERKYGERHWRLPTYKGALYVKKTMHLPRMPKYAKKRKVTLRTGR